jgi:hypothetical protein
VKKLTGILIGMALALGSAAASANVVYTFSAAGFTENVAMQGTARFDFSNDARTLTLTLTDNVDPTQYVLSEISGLRFSFSQAPTAMTLTGVSAPQVIDCSNLAGSSCPSVQGSPDLYGWGTTASDGVMTLGAGFSDGTFGYQPYDIVNRNYIAPGGSGGLSDPANNPLLVGPVTFTFALEGLSYVPEVTSTTFLFGDPAEVPGPRAVPEPESLALFGIGLLAAVFATSRNRRRVRNAA